MIRVEVSVAIDRSSDEVFTYLSEWSNNPEWQKGMKSCTWTSDPPLRVGSTYDQVASFMGKPIISSFEVVEYEPGIKVRIRTTESSMALDITREVSPEKDASRVTATVQGEPAGAMRLFNPLMKLLVKRSVTRDYKRLKEILEGGTGSGSA